MIKSKEFETFGRRYRSKQFPADFAFEMLNEENDPHPARLLANTDAFNEADGQWYNLANVENINIFVFDKAEILAPRLVLRGICTLVHEFNFGFLGDWKGVRVPTRFQADGGINSQHADPLMASLIQANVATLKELQEFYSLEDSFRMFDVMTAKAVSEALAHEAAMKQR